MCEVTAIRVFGKENGLSTYVLKPIKLKSLKGFLVDGCLHVMTYVVTTMSDAQECGLWCTVS